MLCNWIIEDCFYLYIHWDVYLPFYCEEESVESFTVDELHFGLEYVIQNMVQAIHGMARFYASQV